MRLAGWDGWGSEQGTDLGLHGGRTFGGILFELGQDTVNSDLFKFSVGQDSDDLFEALVAAGPLDLARGKSYEKALAHRTFEDLAVTVDRA
jgi:hypothetical protein